MSFAAIDRLYRGAYEGLNYRLRSFAGGRFRHWCRPVSIGILVTNRCNAKCVHCDIWKNRGQENSPTLEEWKQMLSDLRAWLGPVHIFFTGGEALLRVWSVELVEHASRIGLWVEFLTHGYWEDQSRIEKLALANPARVTVSLDGVGDTHTLVRGKAGFFEKTERSLDTLQRIRREKGFATVIRLKTVIMAQNLHAVEDVARYARDRSLEVFYQAVEQNYNTPEDPDWFLTSANWPRDPEPAVAAVRRLIEMREQGYPIRNSRDQLEAMIPYFRDPAAYRLQIQSHQAHEQQFLCAALTNLQLMPNGDVLACWGMPPIGNFRERPIREIWENRPRVWEGGCCIERRATAAEKETLGLVTLER